MPKTRRHRSRKRSRAAYRTDPLSESLLRGEFKGKNLIKIDVQDEEHLKLEGFEEAEPSKSKHAVAQSQKQ